MTSKYLLIFDGFWKFALVAAFCWTGLDLIGFRIKKDDQKNVRNPNDNLEDRCWFYCDKEDER